MELAENCFENLGFEKLLLFWNLGFGNRLLFWNLTNRSNAELSEQNKSREIKTHDQRLHLWNYV